MPESLGTWGEQGQVSGPSGAPPAASGGSNDLARQQYPQYAWALDHPELGAILRQAAAEGWDGTRLQGAIYGTAWWKSTSDSARKWQLVSATDPAKAQELVDQSKASLWDLSKEMGVNIGPDALAALADAQLRFGWSEAQIRNQLGEWYTAGSGPATGTAEATAQRVRNLAYEYAIDVPPGWTEQITKSLLAGDIDENHITAEMQSWAIGKFPSVAKQIESGMTVRQLAQPYIQTAARNLGISADSIDLNDSKWNVFFNQAGKDGPQLMTLFDWERMLRTTPGYKEMYDATPAAKQVDVSLAGAMAERLGLIA